MRQSPVDGVEVQNEKMIARANGLRLSDNSRNLDVLPAIAVLCVYIDHLAFYGYGVNDLGITTAQKLGRVGVLLFFVHTSLVLMMSLDRTAEHHRFGDFYVRRVFRIYPLSLACITLVSLIRIPVSPDLAYKWFGWGTFVANAALVQNVTGSASIAGPLWSLPWEVQMYLILPVLYLMLQRDRALPIIMGTWLVVVVVRYLGYILPMSRVFTVLEFAPCFLAGVVAFQLSRNVSPRLWPSWWPLTILALIVARGALMQGNDNGSPVNNVVNYGMCLLVGCLVPLFIDGQRSCLYTTAHLIAKYSYGIYLFHLPIMWFVFVQMEPAPMALRWLVLVVLSISVPWLAYVLIERPMIVVGQKITRRHSRRATTDVPHGGMELSPVRASQFGSGGVS